MPATKTAWVDCPKCHDTNPATRPVLTPKGKRGRWAACPTCGTAGRVRTIQVRWTIGVPVPRECPPECLNGRSDCTCRCGGRCHGLRVCQCRRHAAWTPPRDEQPTNLTLELT